MQQRCRSGPSLQDKVMVGPHQLGRALTYTSLHDRPKRTWEAASPLPAVAPTAVAAFYRHHRGSAPVEPRPDLGHAANFLYMLGGEEASADRVRWLESYLVLLADHGLNASTFTA